MLVALVVLGGALPVVFFIAARIMLVGNRAVNSRQGVVNKSRTERGQGWKVRCFVGSEPPNATRYSHVEIHGARTLGTIELENDTQDSPRWMCYYDMGMIG